MYDVTGGSKRLQLDPDQLRRRLARLNTRPGSPIMRQAAMLAANMRMDPWDLLALAVERALRHRTSRPDIELVPYLTMLMWSIASSLHCAKARAAANFTLTPVALVHAQIPDHRSIVDPFETIGRRDEQARYELILGSITSGDATLERLVDLIGFGLRGEELRTSLGLSELQLAALRRRLKRRAKAAAAQVAWLVSY